MTLYDDEEAILYDVDLSLPAEELYKNPATRPWAIRKYRYEALVGGAVDWNPLLHPRGPDGRFIHKFGWVRWFSHKTKKWMRGIVTDIDGDTGTVTVKRPDGKADVIFSHAQIAKEVRVIAPPKATLGVDLPDPQVNQSLGPFKKIGGQGGSNPGGLYSKAGLGEVSYESILGLVDKATFPDRDYDTAVQLNMPGDLVEWGTPQDIVDSPPMLQDIRFVGRHDHGGIRDILLYDHKTKMLRNMAGDEITLDQFPEIDGYDDVTWYGSTADGDFFSVEQSLYRQLAEKNQFYVKKAKSEKHAANEFLANLLYEEAGVPVANTYRDGQILASQLVDHGEEKKNLKAAMDDEVVLQRVRENLVVDAWLANWDVVGLNLENIQVIDGVPYRIDAGGSLLYRAMGSPKGALLTHDVGEIDSLRKASINKQAAAVFGGATDADLIAGAERVASVNPAKIKAMVEDLDLPDDLSDTLIARRQTIIDRFDLEDPWVIEEAGEAVIPDYVGLDADKKPITKDENDGTFKWLSGDTDVVPDVPDPDSGDDDAEMSEDAAALTELDEAAAKIPGEEAPVVETLTPSKPAPVAVATSAQTMHDYLQDKDSPGIVVRGEDWKFPKGAADYLWFDGEKWQVSKDTKPKDHDLLGYKRAYGSLDPHHPHNQAGGKLSHTILLPSTGGYDYATRPALRGGGFFGTYELDDVGTPTGNVQIRYPDGEIYKVLPSEDLSPDRWEKYEPSSSEVDAPHPGLNDESLAEVVRRLQVGLHHALSEDHMDGSLGQVASKINQTVADNHLPDSIQVDVGEFTSEVDTKLGHLMAVDVPDSFKPGAWITYGSAAYPIADPPVDSKGRIQVIRENGLPGPIVAGHGLPYALIDPGEHQGMQLRLAAGWSQKGLTGESLPLVKVDKARFTMSAADITPTAPTPNTKASQESVYNRATLKMWAKDNSDSPATAATAMAVLKVLDGNPGTKTFSLSELEMAAEDPDADFNSLDEKIGNYILEHGFTQHLSTPNGGAIPLPQPKETVIPGVSDSLSVGSIIHQDAKGSPEFRKAWWNEHIAGKTFVTDTGSLVYADPDLPLGEARTIDGLRYVSSDDFPLRDVSESVPLDLMVLAKAPTLSKDGKIRADGKVIGLWNVEDAYSYYSSNKTYSYVLFPEFSASGRTEFFKHNSKSTMREYLSAQINPAKTVKPKTVKKAKASKTHQAVKAMVSMDIPGKPQLYDGTEAKRGDWVASTKGGGGFIGKIVGWPNQDTHPGLAFAVSNDGIQKLVNLKTQKKVEGPDADPVTMVNGIPSAYAELKLADGNTPQVGQVVKAGKKGAEIEGLVTNINPEQGWVYILTADGKKKSKTFSVTTVVTPAEDLIWDPKVSMAAAKPTAKNHTKVGKATYAGPLGEVLSQPDEMKDAWLAAHPKRKLTKDGFVPKVGMRVRLKDGTPAVIDTISTKWDKNPNRLGVIVLSDDPAQFFQWKPSRKSVSTSTIEIDHATEIEGFGGTPILAVTGVSAVEGVSGLNIHADTPDGTEIWAVPQEYVYWKDGKHRSVKKWHTKAIDPGTITHSLWKSGWGSWGTPQKIAVIDKEQGNGKLHIGLQPVDPNNNAHYAATHHYGFHAPDGTDLAPDDYVPAYSLKKQQILDEDALDPNKPKTPSVDPKPDAPDTKPDAPDTEVSAEVSADIDYVDDEVGDLDLGSLEMTANNPPEVISQDALKGLAPPSPPIPINPEDLDKKSMPKPVKVPLERMTTVPPILEGKAESMKGGIERLLKQKDSKDPNTGVFYGFGDGSIIDDMLYRFQVVTDPDGKEYVQLRTRMREDDNEAFVDSMLYPTGGMKGAWKLSGTKFAHEFKVGDKVAVKVGSNNQSGDAEGAPSQMLKPLPANDAAIPNATVIEPPKLVGKSPGPNKEGTFATYRIRVRTQDGVEGDLDIQLRPTADVGTYEWDPEKLSTSNTKLSLTPEALGNGWSHEATMAYRKMLSGDTGSAKAGSGEYRSSKGGHVFRKSTPSGTRISVTGPHETEGGIGNDTTRRGNYGGEVRIEVPLDDRPIDEILGDISEGLTSAGLDPDAIKPPSNEELATFAMTKLVATYHPTYQYRAKPVVSPQDPRLAETLNYMNKVLKKHLPAGDPEITLKDLRFHVHDDGRVQPMLSPRVGKAIAKEQGITHFQHKLYGGTEATTIWTSPHSGLLATDERWSRGVNVSGLSSSSDMNIGSGDRVYMTGKGGAPSANIIINPALIGMSLEQYNNQHNNSDNYGRRGATNKFMTSGPGRETMFKRTIPHYFLTHVGSSGKSTVVSAASKGNFGGRNPETASITKSEWQALQNEGKWLDLGMEMFDDDISIADLLDELTEDGQ